MVADDLLQPWWRDDASYAHTEGVGPTRSNAEHYDLCQTHYSQGVLPNTHHQLLSSTLYHHDASTHFTMSPTTTASHFQDTSLPKDHYTHGRDNAMMPDASTTNTLQGTYYNLTQADYHSGNTLPEARQHDAVTEHSTLQASGQSSPKVTNCWTTVTGDSNDATADTRRVQLPVVLWNHDPKYVAGHQQPATASASRLHSTNRVTLLRVYDSHTQNGLTVHSYYPLFTTCVPDALHSDS